MTDQSAQQARRDEIHNAPRPTQLGKDTKTIQEEVRLTELQDTLKVYAMEWVHKFTGTSEDCRTFFDLKFDGRVYENDWRIQPPFEGARFFWLELRLWNVVGEFKTQDAADKFIVDAVASHRLLHEQPISTVGRNSRSEVELRDYGQKKLITGREKLRE